MHAIIHRSPLFALVVALAAAPAFAQDDLEAKMKGDDRPSDAQVELRNQSRWSLQELYFAPIGSDRWGPNQLGHHSVHPDGTFTLTGIRCDKYDVKMVDEDDNECIVRDVSLCGADRIWRIDNRDLERCQARTNRE
ncbi:MAG TPA: hypothetical protein VFS55_14095 [Dokdonella sp.]|nr:hypothetical protein [Dokdonella sp.]